MKSMKHVSVSKLQLEQFLGYIKSGRTPQAPQFGSTFFVYVCGFIQFDFVDSDFTTW
jgi:hypothetical protein